jgi:hypothetical protein
MSQPEAPQSSRGAESQGARGENTRGHRTILIGIVVAILVGIAVGGWAPGIAVKFYILGEVFLNSLMMIVVPLVVFSMIVGITGLGDIRKLGSIGWRTVLYYMATTGVSVLIGIVLVNIIQPGREISHGEEHATYAYTLTGERGRTVRLADETWDKTRYNEKYVVVLLDQSTRGVIESASENTVTVKFWEEIEAKDVFYVKSEDGTRLPFRNVRGQLVYAEPELASSGVGVKIELPVGEWVLGKEEKGVGGTLREVLVGDKKTGKEGMVPRNIINAMVRMDILPLIVFSLLIGAALSVLGERGRSAVEVISVLNDAVMRLVGWIMVVAPVGIFGLIAGRIGEAGGFSGFLPELYALGKYSSTVLIGLAIHGLIVLPLILLLVGRRNPVRYATGVGSALLCDSPAYDGRSGEGKQDFQQDCEFCSSSWSDNKYGRHRTL